MDWLRSMITWKERCHWFSSSRAMLPVLRFPPLPFCSFQLFNLPLPQCLESSPSVPLCSLLCSLMGCCHLLHYPHLQPSCPNLPLHPPAPRTPRYPVPWAVGIMRAWFQYFPSFLCSLLCRLMQIPNFNKQLLNMSLTLLRLQMKLCYWDYSGSYSFVMSFVNHSWPAVYRMKLRLSSFFLRLLSFFHKELLFYSPKDWLLAQIRESETLIQNSQAFLYLKPATPSTFPPGNYIRIVYTRNCHLIIMKLVLSWQKWA